MSTLRFTRDEATDMISFLIKSDKKTTRLRVTMLDFSHALMAGKEVKCNFSVDEPVIEKKKKRKKK